MIKPFDPHQRAPEFNLRNPEELKEFLEEFEELAERHGLMTKEKTKIVVKYVNKETKKFWKRLEDFGDNYMILKRKIMGAYSKTLLENKPTVCHKLHLDISPSNLRRFPRSQSQLKALKKTFRSMPVTSQGNQ